MGWQPSKNPPHYAKPSSEIKARCAEFSTDLNEADSAINELVRLKTENRRLKERNEYLEECVRALDNGNQKISDELSNTRRELQTANELIERIKARLFEMLGTLPNSDNDVEIDFYYDDGLDSMGRYIGQRELQR